MDTNNLKGMYTATYRHGCIIVKRRYYISLKINQIFETTLRTQ